MKKAAIFITGMCLYEPKDQKSIYLNLANEYRRRRNPSRTFRSLGARCNSRGRHLLQTAAKPSATAAPAGAEATGSFGCDP